MLRLNELFILAASLCAPNCYREAFQSPDGRSSLSLAIVWRREVLCLVIFQFLTFLTCLWVSSPWNPWGWNKGQNGPKVRIIYWVYIMYSMLMVCNVYYIPFSKFALNIDKLVLLVGPFEKLEPLNQGIECTKCTFNETSGIETGFFDLQIGLLLIPR